MLMRLLISLPKARRWVRTTTAAHDDHSRPVASFEFSRLEQFFDRALLEQTHISIVDHTPRPPLEQWGLHAADDFSMMDAAGITLDRLILIRRGCEFDESLLFHELVHAVQWRRLGLGRFLGLYGLLLLERGYLGSPLEEMAYGLQRRFDRGGPPFGAVPVIERRTDEIAASFRKRSLLHRLALSLAAVSKNS